MTKTRRTIDAALGLDSNQLNFIAGNPGTAVPALPTASLPTTTTLVSTIPAAAQELPPRSAKPPRSKQTDHPRSPKPTPQPETPSPFLGRQFLVPLTTRLSVDTADTLRRVALENRIRGKNPATVQQIAEIAILQWLEKNGNTRVSREMQAEIEPLATTIE
jgi:hypothetical protein